MYTEAPDAALSRLDGEGAPEDALTRPEGDASALVPPTAPGLGSAPLRVYVAAAHGRAAVVQAIHERMRASGLEPTATWPYREPVAVVPAATGETSALSAANRADLERSDAVLVLVSDAAALVDVVAHAAACGLAVFLVADPEAAHRGVRVCGDVSEGLEQLAALQRGTT